MVGIKIDPKSTNLVHTQQTTAKNKRLVIVHQMCNNSYDKTTNYIYIYIYIYIYMVITKVKQKSLEKWSLVRSPQTNIFIFVFIPPKCSAIDSIWSHDYILPSFVDFHEELVSGDWFLYHTATNLSQSERNAKGVCFPQNLGDMIQNTKIIDERLKMMNFRL